MHEIADSPMVAPVSYATADAGGSAESASPSTTWDAPSVTSGIQRRASIPCARSADSGVLQAATMVLRHHAALCWFALLC